MPSDSTVRPLYKAHSNRSMAALVLLPSGGYEANQELMRLAKAIADLRTLRKIYTPSMTDKL